MSDEVDGPVAAAIELESDVGLPNEKGAGLAVPLPKGDDPNEFEPPNEKVGADVLEEVFEFGAGGAPKENVDVGCATGEDIEVAGAGAGAGALTGAFIELARVGPAVSSFSSPSSSSSSSFLSSSSSSSLPNLAKKPVFGTENVG